MNHRQTHRPQQNFEGYFVRFWYWHADNMTVAWFLIVDWFGIVLKLFRPRSEYVDKCAGIRAADIKTTSGRSLFSLTGKSRRSNTVYLFPKPIFTETERKRRFVELRFRCKRDTANKSRGYTYTNGQNRSLDHFSHVRRQGVRVCSLDGDKAIPLRLWVTPIA